MISNLNILLPEIFLSLSIFTILMLGVFIKKSFNLIFNLSSVVIIITILIIFNNTDNIEKIDNDKKISGKSIFKLLIIFLYHI